MDFNIFAATGMSLGIRGILQFITLLIVFIFVLFVTYLTTRFIGNYQKTNIRTTNFEVIETYRVNNTKYLQIIRVGKRYLVISVCKDRIDKLTELSEDEVSIPEPAANDSFSKIFEKVKDSFNRKQEGKEQNDDDEDE